MAIRAVVFDIGGVLEITPDLGVTEKWEQRLLLKAGELNEQMGSLWDDGAVGKCTLEDVVRGLRERLGVQPAEMIFLDDNEQQLVTARELGIYAILFQNTAQAIADIEAVLHARSI